MLVSVRSFSWNSKVPETILVVSTNLPWPANVDYFNLDSAGNRSLLRRFQPAITRQENMFGPLLFII